MRSGTAAQHERILQLFERHASDARAAGLTRVAVEAADGDLITVDGGNLVNFGNCAYTAINSDPRVKAAAIDAVNRFGAVFSSSTAYTFIDLYSQLEERLSRMFDAHVVVPTTTTLAHLSCLPVVIGPGSVVLMDAQAHSSLHLAAQVVKSEGIEVTLLAHNDVEELENAVEVACRSGQQVWYIADGVYSMLGDTAPVEVIESLLRRHDNLWVYIDDAHGVGWTGKHGRGVVLDRMDLHPRLIVAASLVKGVGAGGAALLFADPELAHRVQILAGPMTFSGPLNPAGVGAAVAAIEIMLSDEQPEMQRRINEQIDVVLDVSRGLGLPLASFERTPIWFARIGRHDQMIEIGRRMREDGFYLNPASFPVVPFGESGLRFTHTLHHDLETIEAMLRSMAHHITDVVGSTRVIDLTDPALVGEVDASLA